MPPSMSRTVEYRFKMVDNVTPTAQQATDATDKLNEKVKETNASVDNQALLFIKNITVLTAFREGLNGMINEMHTLGIVSDKSYQSLRQIAAVPNMIVDVVRMIRGLVGIMEMLKTTEIGLAIVESFRMVLNSRGAGLAIVGAAGAAAGGAAGFFAGKSAGRREVRIEQTNNFNAATSASDARSQQRSALESWEGY